jgi:diguanylate cyclase (GGDEF)-like protein/PAS domain S-box-containing protein
MTERERLRELIAINGLIASSLDYDEVLRLVVEKTAAFTGAETCLLLLADAAGQVFVTASQGIDPARAERFRAPLDERIDAALREFFGLREQTFVGLPVVNVHGLPGILVVYLRGDRAARPDEAFLLAALAGQAAIALQHATRYRELRRDLRDRQTLTERIFQHAPLGFCVLDSELVVRELNATGARLLDRPQASIVGRPLGEALADAEATILPLCRGALAGTLPAHAETHYETYHTARDTVIEMVFAALPDETGAATAVLMIFGDITPRLKAEAQLGLAARVIEHSGEGIMITGPDNRIVSVNPAFTRITGYTADDVVGHNPRLLRSDRQDPDLYTDLWDALARTGVWRGEICNRHKDGRSLPQWLSISTICNESGIVQHYIGIYTDIAEQKRAEERIRHLAYYDVLTHLPNRALFQERLAWALAQAERHRGSLAVLVLDLDRFKHINDSLGHGVGDALLQEVAHRMKQSLRARDTVARPGGDEFMLILPETDAGGAAHTAEKIVACLSEPIRLGRHELHITCSLGISIYPENGRDSDSLLQRADAAMYRAKQQGRNDYRFFTDEMHQETLQVLTLEQQLRQALERDEFLLHYQPQIDISSGRPIGCEALLRWQHPERGLVMPGDFIGVAEDSGLIMEIGFWVLRQVAFQIKAWETAGSIALPISVNLSAVQFHRNHRKCVLADRVARVLDESGIAPERLELEITETAIMEDSKQTVLTLSLLRKMGVRLAIDDFGTGYSSLAYLKHFPVDRLKIDQSFIRNIAVDAEDEAIVDAVLSLGTHFRMEVIAEGVETEQQLARLREKGCGQAQGYYFSRPLPIEELDGWLQGQPLRCP